MVIEYVRMAFSGIWSHKLRSFLTMLGVIIGIASIIAIASTILGINEQIKQNLIGAGNNAVQIKLYQGDYEYYLDYQDIPEGIPFYDESTLERVREVDNIEEASFYHRRWQSGNVFYGSTALNNGVIYGIDGNYMNVYGYMIRSGRGITDKDRKEFAKVALIDETIESSLFSGKNAVGEIIDISGEPFRVIGVYTQANSFKPTINTIDDYYMYTNYEGGAILIPEEIWPSIYRYDEPPSLVIRASSTEAMTSAGNAAKDIMNENVTAADIKYKSEDMLEQAKQMQDLSNATNQQLLWIAAISLLVGGIGVMNIMLVSVMERTREIGLKKALGAKKRMIVFQFLTEAGVLTCLGGIFGVIFGIILAFIISAVSGVPVMISAPIAAAAVVFSFIIGLFFGAFPAMKAAKLNPIDALRYD